jgi:hypothetical protein|tara:strand:- start:5649 stop:5867 length:219 start_codon:yes stop_codon:yes gene_type:complete
MTEDFKKKFCIEVMQYVEESQDSYIDAVLAISARFGFGPEMGAKFISKPIIEKIKIEGEDINLLPKLSQLPF